MRWASGWGCWLEEALLRVRLGIGSSSPSRSQLRRSATDFFLPSTCSDPPRCRSNLQFPCPSTSSPYVYYSLDLLYLHSSMYPQLASSRFSEVEGFFNLLLALILSVHPIDSSEFAAHYSKILDAVVSDRRRELRRAQYQM
jgi:hypothetical protein